MPSLNREQIDLFYNRNIDLRNRTIYFGPWQLNEGYDTENAEWEVNDHSISNIIKGLYILEQAKVSTITIIWNSEGGSWDSGMALFDYIKYIKSPVNMKCFGRVRSMGTVILQACNKRYLSKNCLFLIHYGTSNQNETHTKDHIKFAKQLEKENAKMEDIYLKRIKEKHPSYKKESLQNLMKYDKYMSPKEAINLGLSDRLI